MARPRRSDFSGRSPARCLPPFWELSRYHQHLSVLRDEHWDRLKGCRVADTMIKAHHSLWQHCRRAGPTARGTPGDFGFTDLAHQYGHGLDNPAYATGLGQVAADRDTARRAGPVAPHRPHAFSEHQLSWGDGVSAGTLPESSDPGAVLKDGTQDTRD